MWDYSVLVLGLCIFRRRSSGRILAHLMKLKRAASHAWEAFDRTMSFCPRAQVGKMLSWQLNLCLEGFGKDGGFLPASLVCWMPFPATESLLLVL